MAHIHGITPGLVPVGDTSAIAEQKKRRTKKLAVAPDEVVCDICRGQVGFNTARTKQVNPCTHCVRFFGIRIMSGTTNISPETSERLVADARKERWVMVLRRGTFGSAGTIVTVEPGDVFKVARTGDKQRHETKEPVSSERTSQIFSVEIGIGGHKVTLFPHEFSAMPFTTLMRLKKSGDLKEVYVSADDEVGHFAPPQELRDQIYEAFGPRVGRQPHRKGGM